MLSSRNRLKKKTNFARVEIDGELIQSKSFGIGIYDRSKDFGGDSNNTDSRFGFIISTRISKKAVVRNRIKRIIADCLRLNIDRVKKGLDVIFLIKPNAIKIKNEELKKEVYDCIVKNL